MNDLISDANRMTLISRDKHQAVNIQLTDPECKCNNKVQRNQQEAFHVI